MIAGGAYGKSIYTRRAGRSEGAHCGIRAPERTRNFRQLADKTGVSKTAIRRLSGALAASGDVWLSGCGVFPSEQAYRVWRKTPEKAADPTLIRKLPDGEIRRYNRRQNIICRECRQSEVMQRVLAFYRGNFQEVME